MPTALSWEENNPKDYVYRPSEAMIRLRKEIEQKKESEEERIRKSWLPEPQTRRRRRVSSSGTPAREHHDAIAKFMKRSGSKHSQAYRRSTKHHTTDEELEGA